MVRKGFLVAISYLIAGSAGATASAQAVPKIRFEKYTLPNGLEVILAALYPKGHPHSWSVIGSLADLSAASVDDVKDFFGRPITP